MSETKWTPAQRAAIDDRGGALLVSAAAGSGKTAVLTERGRAFVSERVAPLEALEAEAWDSLSREEQAVLIRLLRRFSSSMAERLTVPPKPCPPEEP